MSQQTIRVTHFSDALCIWAYISQIRIDELLQNFPHSVEIEYRYFHVFGNVPLKIQSGWQTRGGLQGYSDHVKEVAAKFNHIRLSEDVWMSDTPKSSMPCHLFLCAVRWLDSQNPDEVPWLARTARAVRKAFFTECVDVSRTDALFDIGSYIGLPVHEVREAMNHGWAHAALAEDLELVRTHGIQGSPTLLFNEGRQRLSGNVGYRIIEANIRELLEGSPSELSWC
jgi:predicted DsbA family dithiol-disulfide isomerase